MLGTFILYKIYYIGMCAVCTNKKNQALKVIKVVN